MTNDRLNPNDNVLLGKMLAESASVLIWIADTTKACIYFNKAWLSFRGRTLEQEYGDGWAEGVHPNDFERCLKIYTSSFDSRESFSMDYRLMHHDGDYRWIRDDGDPYFDESGEFQGYIGSCFDITEIVESRARFQQLVEVLPAGLCLTDAMGDCTYVNPHWREMTGIGMGAAMGKGWLRAIHPDDRQKLEVGLDLLLESQTTHALEYRFLHSDDSVSYIYGLISRFNTQEGDLAGYVGISLDVTEQRELQDRIQHVDKLDAIGQLAGGVAHDFNNQLSGILGYSELIAESLKDPKLKGYAERISAAARRSGDLTSKLLAFSRKGTRQNVRVDIDTMLSDTRDMLLHSIDKRIVVEFNPSNASRDIIGDPSQLQSVVLNLALNARDAMPEGGTLTLGSCLVTLQTGSPVCLTHRIAPGDYMVISVSDVGTGIPAEVLPHLFEPFYTTKEEGKGTGMGLASAYGTVKQHKGCIEVSSVPGEGSTLEVYLPVTNPDELDETDEDVASGMDSVGPLRILVVEDEKMIRDLSYIILSRAGHSVLFASDGQEGIDLYRDQWRDIDVVVLDMIMPRVNGLAAYRAMQEVNPDVIALLASGYSIAEHAQEMIEEGVNGVIQKPFIKSEYLQAIQDAVLSTRT